MRFFLVVKSTFQASCEQILRILASSQIVWKFSSFFMPKNALMRSSEIHVSTAPSFVCANLCMYQTSAFWQPEKAISADS